MKMQSILLAIVLTFTSLTVTAANRDTTYDDHGTEVMVIDRQDMEYIWDEFLMPGGLLAEAQSMGYDVFGLEAYVNGEDDTYTMIHGARHTDAYADDYDAIYWLSQDEFLNNSAAVTCFEDSDVCYFYFPGTSAF